ncbi:unnamed protein product, partial [Mesorhabditis belari]|uniref:RING-type domain-containing protein n=1 Tax=Mesorhabditis belari TaxID=2138241 RepID=A0AAF3J3Q0_9BILA
MPSTNILTCRLCQEIFLEPVVFPCGHTFCLACSEEWRKRQRVCPQAGCDKSLGEAVPNLLVKEPRNEESPAHESPPLRRKKVTFDQPLHQRQEATQPHPSKMRYIFNGAFVRGTRGRRTEIHQMPSLPVCSNRRSLKEIFCRRPKEMISGKSTDDFALGKGMNHEWDDVWMGDEQQHESEESPDLASHPMYKLMQAKKDKSFWSKTKLIFSSNKAKK